MIRGRRFQAGLAACCATLAGVIYLELERPPLDPGASAAPVARDAPSGRTGGAVTKAATPSFALPPLSDFAEVTARPLFQDGRRPLPPTARNTAAPLPSVVVVGIVSSGAQRHALVEHGRPARIDRVVEGQALDGWTVEEIRQDGLIMRNGQNLGEVKVKDKPPPARPAAAPAAAPPRAPAGVVAVPPPNGGAAPAASSAPAQMPPPAPPAVQDIRM
jgi:hypothetical protein